MGGLKEKVLSDKWRSGGEGRRKISGEVTAALGCRGWKGFHQAERISSWLGQRETVQPGSTPLSVLDTRRNESVHEEDCPAQGSAFLI